MPAQLSFFDMSVNQTQPTYAAPVPITTGPNFRPNDIRLVLQFCFLFGSSFDLSVTPPGYTDFSSGQATGMRCSYRRLVAGDTDTFIQYGSTTSFSVFIILQVTVRGVSPSAVPVGATVSVLSAIPGASTTGGSVSVPTFSVPVGAGLSWSSSFSSSGTTTACTLGAPTTGNWTNLVASPGSGIQYTPFGAESSTILFGQSFSSAGTTPAFSIQYGAEDGAHVYTMGVTLTAAADVAPGVSTPLSTVATATAATFSTSTAVSITAGSATTTATATTAFNPLYGVWVSDPLTLPGNSVTGSVVRWASTTPLGTTISIQTSINNGASWDNAVNNSPVPRLATGDTTTRSVLIRAILTRTNATDPPPRVTTLEVQVSVDAGVDELVPVGHGMIDKVTTTAVGGSTGTGSITSVVSSTAVTSRGGGQTGGGTSIKVHVIDLSGAIKRNVWAMPYTVPSGLNYGAAAQAMVVNRLPSQTAFAISSTTVQTPLLVYGMQQGGDPWQDIQDLATAIGFEAFFDPSGVFVFRPVPDPSVGDAVWEFDEDANPLVSEASRELSNEQTFNHIIVAGQSTSSSNPVTAEAFDNNPSSPTYILGPYGEVTERVTFSTITTQAQAQTAANALLFNSLGGADTVTITCVPMPALEPGDIVKVNISDVNVDGNYMVNSMTTSLSPADPQQLVCFRQSTS